MRNQIQGSESRQIYHLKSTLLAMLAEENTAIVQLPLKRIRWGSLAFIKSNHYTTHKDSSLSYTANTHWHWKLLFPAKQDNVQYTFKNGCLLCDLLAHRGQGIRVSIGSHVKMALPSPALAIMLLTIDFSDGEAYIQSSIYKGFLRTQNLGSSYNKSAYIMESIL